ncbi:hypothetical protein SDRG_15452 [Saprolegnia diclina VS20]|uniref:Neurotransmitter-gated ion-channel ligand-binding domain-containing protein n=1 Tax=Saprolegnia diclina (strain VS20) TaxID=1156394 RepID=T0R3V0_SAPDV|nr:hypothetical protein SDRG_15452 [Saprolegnia diclina VS20]EQC26723.1 hypothetical protein SDRG_15452 [Saprolegnia diclina VS20]|eukprot:XP_008619847.1 hypothetical protein SDRG_15452 [Saprolegnia diclina VS20]
MPIVHTRVDGNPTLRPKSHDDICSAFLLPPLLLHCRTTIFNVYRIDTVGQTFDADVYFELRLRAIATPAVDEAWVTEVASAIGLSEKTIDCLNVVSQDGSREMWCSYSIRSMIPGHADYCFKLRLRGSFSEQLELQSFPFDTQQLHVIWTVNLPGTYVRLRANEHFPSLFLRNNFQLGNVFDVVSAEHVIALVDQSDAVESSSGHIYDHCSTSIVLQRKPGYYITNILLPMGLLTYLGFLSFAIESPNTRLATPDRLSISLTLLLTAVAYKFVVAGAIPQIPYMTTLDMHTTLSFVFLTTTAVENALFPSICASDGCFDIETIVLCVLAALITVGYLYISFGAHYDLRARAAEHKALIDYHLLQILIAQTYPTQPDVVRAKLLAEVCAATKTPVTTTVGDGKRTVLIKKSAGLCNEFKERCLCELATCVTRLGKLET